MACLEVGTRVPPRPGRSEATDRRGPRLPHSKWVDALGTDDGVVGRLGLPAEAQGRTSLPFANPIPEPLGGS